MPEATVIVPTHEHGPTLRHAVGSALRQTISDIEVIVIGDGVTDETREVIEELLRQDQRVRFLDRPKGPGHGFVHRHEAVEGAASDRILYLSDDDLWFPEHAAMLCELLEEADFAAGLAINLRPEGPRLKPRDLSLPYYQERVRSRAAQLQLSAVGHTQDAYRRLSHGWLVETLNYKAVWAQFFESPWRTASAGRPTVLQFPSPARAELSLDARAAELESWEGALARSTERLELTEQLFAMELRRSAELTSRVAIFKAKRDEQKRRTLERTLARAAQARLAAPRWLFHRGRSPAAESRGNEASRSESTGPSGGSGQSSDSAGSSNRTPSSSAGSQ
jgi:GalNAc5-diNAcBac-PP-undecaprenol beta-1,3-glucosyltransferase